jgi:replicative DNA helicase
MHPLSDVLPMDLDAERALIGAVLSNTADFSHIAALVSVDDFSLESHRRIWLAAKSLWETGTGIDRVTVATSSEIRATWRALVDFLD